MVLVNNRLQLGLIGLGKMGGGLAEQAIDKGIKVVAHSKHRHPDIEVEGVHVADDDASFAGMLKTPRVIYLSLPAGPTIDSVLGELTPHLSKGDVVMDGGNSYYLDSIQREKEMAGKGIYFLDCGTSGGVIGARTGACFMVGGPRKGFDIVEPVLKDLAVMGGVLYTGEPGTGHFVKLVHNGIEFGMNQSIGEGVELLRHSGFNLDIEKIFENWSHGSVIRSWLIELMAQGLKEQDLDGIPAYVEDTGEVNWLVQDAIDRELYIPVISLSIMELFASRGSGLDTRKAIAMLRHGYGRHPFGKDVKIAKERETSRITKI
ncbi:MAG TPA: decarboxylating 6-phosphogluconate dehydrogenase [Methanocella sp.]|nr:decarboxylating 6-phosphogluconate dehydrogenase [Methanocella sp.]